MKILFIHNNYASNNSGEEHAAEALKVILESNGHHVKWFRRFSDIIENSFIKKVQAFFLAIYNPKAIRELKWVLDEFQPDIVQIQNLYPFISPGIIKTIKRREIPLVMRCPNYRLFCPTGLHLDRKGTICERCLSGSRELNCVLKNCEGDLPKSIGYALRNFIARTFWKVTQTMDAYIVQTAFQRQKFINNGIPAHKLFIIPGLVPEINTVLAVKKPKYVTFIGRVSEEKGIHEFLEAAQLLPKISFVVAGNVDESQKSIVMNSPSNVIWKGFVSGKDLDVLYAKSKMVVVPSKWYEGFPNVITKAMKHSKPVITSDIGAMSNIIDHNQNGMLVEPGDVVGLAKTINELFEDDAKVIKLGKNGFVKASTLYSGSKVYDTLSLVYRGLLQEKERKTKRVLCILHYPPPVHGAAMVGSYIMESKRINTMFDNQYINLGTSVRIDEIGNAGWLKLKRYLNICISTFKEILKEKPRLVYITLSATGFGFYKDALVVFIVKTFGVKVVYHFHNKGVILRQQKWWDNKLYEMVFRDVEVILLSKYLYGDIQKYVSKEHVHFCPNGIPALMSAPPQKKTQHKTVQLLFLSNLIASKGVYVLLQACALLIKKNIDFYCTLIGNTGDISLVDFQDEVSKMGLANFVFYAGPKFGKEKEKAYASSDIFVFPTFYDKECFPLVLLEAMQFGLPAVSTHEGGVPEIVLDGETGFLIAKKDPEALAEKLEALINNPLLRQQMGQAGRQRFEEHFTLDAFEARFANIMEKLIQ